MQEPPCFRSLTLTLIVFHIQALRKYILRFMSDIVFTSEKPLHVVALTCMYYIMYVADSFTMLYTTINL